MHIVVMGAGGVGGYFGAKLARSGEAVTMIARGEHLAAIRRNGLRIRSAVDGDSVVRPAAVERIRPVVGPETAVLSLQNGVDNEDRIDALLGPGHAMGGVAQVFAVIERPGVIAHHFAGRIIFGELDGRRSPRAERLLAAFERAGINVELSTDVRRALWEKYILICAVAGMTAITRETIGTVRETPECWRMFRAIVDETTALARECGVGLAPDAVDAVLKLAQGIAAGNRASLAQDLLQGRRLELEALHGHAVRLGERLGVPTPAVFAVYAALKPHVAGRRG